MKTLSKVLLFCIFLLISTGAFAQNDHLMTSEAQLTGKAILTGPFGDPVLVSDTFGNYSTPIKTYSDQEIDTFVQDVTTPGWISWFGKQFQEKGTYDVFIYTHFKKTSYCLREFVKNDSTKSEVCSHLYYRGRLIHVDTRGHSVTVLENILFDNTANYASAAVEWPRKIFPLPSGVSPGLAKEITRITSIITETVSRAGNFTSAQEIMQRNKEISARSARCAGILRGGLMNQGGTVSPRDPNCRFVGEKCICDDEQ
jgi:hypothetical protein